MLTVRLRKELPGSSAGGPRPAANAAESASASAASDGFVLDVVFDAPAGVTIVFGASGSGKSLTLRAVAGLLRPDTGAIRIDDLTLFDSSAGVNLPARARRVGYVFQNLALFPHLTARENVEFALADSPRHVRRGRALELLERFRVAHAAERRPRHISGGEAQRVALARALAARPRLLLLDEPLSALDDEIKLGVIADLKLFNREARLPILYVTHSRDEALALGERAVVYERGRVVAAGLPADVFDAPVKASVARLTGVENLFEGSVVERNEAAGTMLILINSGGGGCRIEVPIGARAAGDRVTLGIRSGDLLLSTPEPRGLSARNLLRGRVVGIEPRGGETLVRVECGGLEWSASVTRQSVKDLKLEAGAEVWLIFKTYSCRVYDAA